MGRSFLYVLRVYIHTYCVVTACSQVVKKGAPATSDFENLRTLIKDSSAIEELYIALQIAEIDPTFVVGGPVLSTG
jgi:hypothetical protein